MQKGLLLACVSLALALTAAPAGEDEAKEYHLLQSQVADEVPLKGSVSSATVYVLVCPDQRIYVFSAVHSHPMEEIIKHFPRGSLLHYDGNALAETPPKAQMQALVDSCEKKGIKLILTPTN